MRRSSASARRSRRTVASDMPKCSHNAPTSFMPDRTAFSIASRRFVTFMVISVRGANGAHLGKAPTRVSVVKPALRAIGNACGGQGVLPAWQFVLGVRAGAATLPGEHHNAEDLI